ncbi:hypothetical protein EPN83_00840 [Patescibacteria group bacterium]|nr:MAG: hypothetical protein EPN83_00840 [Patescibacteria group bacterium]
MHKILKALFFFELASAFFVILLGFVEPASWLYGPILFLLPLGLLVLIFLLVIRILKLNVKYQILSNELYHLLFLSVFLVLSGVVLVAVTYKSLQDFQIW